MLTYLRLENFRGFRLHEIPLRPISILVGENNAGKSTITEALRLISLVTSRYRSLSYRKPPMELNLPKIYRGVSPSLVGMGFNDISLFHNLGDPPARIEARFEDGASIEIRLGKGADFFAAILKKDKETINSKSNALQYDLPSVSILPQVGPLASEEKILDRDYVRRVSSTPLASLHFRNHLRLFPETVGDFKQMAESTWPGLRIRGLEGADGFPGDNLALLIQEGEFVSEVAWVGHGLQMWLQTIWFLARSIGSDTVILDEPDVYMHADLQRNLIRLLKRRHKQVVIATHSIEIMSEVNPSNILIIDRESKRSQFATSIPAVQETIKRFGSIHNFQLSRLWNSRKFLLVEGKDLQYLKVLQNILYPDSALPIDTVPNMQIGGWGGWPYAIGSRMVLRNALGEEITAYCILDSDYHTEDEKQQRVEDAQDKGINLHIWERKEIENYFLLPKVIARVIRNEAANGIDTSEIDTEGVLLNIADGFKDQIFDILATEYLARDKAGGVSKANKNARKRINLAWKTDIGRLAIAPGKRVISSLSSWSQDEYGVALSPMKLLRSMERLDVNPELLRVIRAIEKGYKLS
jgi:hypothetical protein